MADISDVILILNGHPPEKLAELNEKAQFIDEHRLVACDEAVQPGWRWYGGDRHLSNVVCPAAFKGPQLTRLIQAMREIDWESELDGPPQLFVCGPDDERFKELDWLTCSVEFE